MLVFDKGGSADQSAFFEFHLPHNWDGQLPLFIEFTGQTIYPNVFGTAFDAAAFEVKAFCSPGDPLTEAEASLEQPWSVLREFPISVGSASALSTAANIYSAGGGAVNLDLPANCGAETFVQVQLTRRRGRQDDTYQYPYGILGVYVEYGR